MRAVLSGLRTEPDVEVPPARGWRDGVLAAAVTLTALAEVALRDDLLWRPVAVVVAVTLALAVLERRTHPLAATALGFGALAVVDLASVVLADEPFFLYAGAVVIVLVHALFRWGSNQQAAIGSVVVLAEWAVAITTDFTGVADAVGGLLVLLLAAALGVVVRYRRLVRTQQLEGVRSHERELLARELHDTVAHHVSAIAIQAQAGQVLARSADLRGATEALAVIETEASRTLAEMRQMVGSLRGAPGAAYTQRGAADLHSLATPGGAAGLRVEIEYGDGLDGLRPPVEAALFRVAQESVTNAQRHARHATGVRVVVAGESETVHLTITDDGQRALSARGPAGYGLVGMAERVTLLGGTLEAGPGVDRGWTVRAMIPRHGGRA